MSEWIRIAKLKESRDVLEYKLLSRPPPERRNVWDEGKVKPHGRNRRNTAWKMRKCCKLLVVQSPSRCSIY
jgi:hypothetical protein